jgi:SNF2 family DNA or RNA helicase
MAVDHLDMPELINNYIEVTLAPTVFKQYKTMERDFLIKIQDDTVVAFNTAALGVKCRQICNGFIYNENHEALPIHGQKLEALLELVDEMQGRPLLLCYEFIEDARAIQAILPGAVNISERKDTLAVVKSFNEGKIPVLMGHPKSMGHGLNLQEICKDICWFGITWDLELYQQAIARVWRQGQPSPVVNCHHIVAKDTLDLEVVKRLAEKDATQNRLNTALKTLPLSPV